ncbi:hypothetical protein HY640_04465 [Candidatus Woesearchaeota archaeon]|nr:hypothetical protein [Candidatus Woesearchaeota archaeon]
MDNRPHVLIVYRSNLPLVQIGHIQSEVDSVGGLSGEVKETFDKFKKEVCPRIRPGNIVSPYFLAEYCKSIVSVLDYVYSKGNIGIVGIGKHDFYARVLGPGNQFYEWVKGAFDLGIIPTAVDEDTLKRMEKDKYRYGEFLRDFNIHVLCMTSWKYDPAIVRNLIAGSRVVVGYDEPMHKVNFSVLPFILTSKVILENVRGAGGAGLFRSKISGIYYDELVRFGVNYGSRITSMIPPFISFPSKTKVDKEKMGVFYEFFKGRCRKVIVKGDCSAASGISSYPYVILDVNEPQAVDNWLIHVHNYLQFGGNNVVMMQCMVGSEDSVHPFHTGFDDCVRIAAHKHNVVGGSVWETGIKYVYMAQREMWEGTKAAKIGVKADKQWTREGLVQECFSCRADLSGWKSDLEVVGEFLNLVSPLGAHALDMVIGKLSEETEHRLYLLEANASRVRGDHTGMNFFTGSNSQIAYLTWALSHLRQKADASGSYTRMLFQELNARLRDEFIASVDALWKFTTSLTQREIILCDGELKVWK